MGLLFVLANFLIDRTGIDKNGLRKLFLTLGGLAIVCSLVGLSERSYFWLGGGVLTGIIIANILSEVAYNYKQKIKAEGLLEFTKTDASQKERIAQLEKMIAEKEVLSAALDLVDPDVKTVTVLLYEQDYEGAKNAAKEALKIRVLSPMKEFIKTLLVSNNIRGANPSVSLFLINENGPLSQLSVLVGEDLYKETKDFINLEYHWDTNTSKGKSLASYCGLTGKPIFYRNLAEEHDFVYQDILTKFWANTPKTAKTGALYCHPYIARDESEGQPTLAVLNITIPEALPAGIELAMLSKYVNIYSYNILSLVYLFKCASDMCAAKPLVPKAA